MNALALGIVIVNWNTRDLLRECLRSVQDSDPSVTRRVIVVDNASADGSADMVSAEFPAVEVIAMAAIVASRPAIIWACGAGLPRLRPMCHVTPCC